MKPILIPTPELFKDEIDELEAAFRGVPLPITGDEETQALIREELSGVAAQQRQRLHHLYLMREHLTLVNNSALGLLLDCLHDDGSSLTWRPTVPDQTLQNALKELRANMGGFFHEDMAQELEDHAAQTAAC